MFGLLMSKATGLVWADTALQGSYSVSTTPPSVWTIKSANCTPHCAAWVKSSDGWQSYAGLSANIWTLSVYRGTWKRSSYPADPAICPTPGRADYLRSESFTVNAATLTGTVERIRGDQCGGPTVRDSEPISLSRLD